MDVLQKSIYFKMQKNHDKTLRVIYQSDESYENLLNVDNSVSLHQRHLRILVTEIFKGVSKKNPNFMWSYFSSKNVSYNLRKGPSLLLRSAKSTMYETNSVHFKGTLIWNNVPILLNPVPQYLNLKEI